ncbi:hypothetical protein EJ110_NYTH38637 [Nymphaea thermarum]|nr:hypothetical protein EJ110_NYTH38637 [Nymphaea thermarum]
MRLSRSSQIDRFLSHAHRSAAGDVSGVNVQAAGSYSYPSHEDCANPTNEEDHDKSSEKATILTGLDEINQGHQSHLRKDYRRIHGLQRILFNQNVSFTQMLGLIESQDMMGFIEGQISIPTSTIEIVENGEARSVPNPEFLAWKKSYRLLRGWITGSLSEEVLGLVVGLQTSSEVWTALLKAFARESKDREFLLTRKLQTFQKQEKNVTEYVIGFKTICDELAAIGKPLSDQDKVYWLINGLGSGYESFMTSILRPPIPAYIDVVSLLESHDNMKHIHGFQLNHNAAFISQQVPSQPS